MPVTATAIISSTLAAWRAKREGSWKGTDFVDGSKLQKGVLERWRIAQRARIRIRKHLTQSFQFLVLGLNPNHHAERILLHYDFSPVPKHKLRRHGFTCPP